MLDWEGCLVREDIGLDRVWENAGWSDSEQAQMCAEGCEGAFLEDQHTYNNIASLVFVELDCIQFDYIL